MSERIRAVAVDAHTRGVLLTGMGSDGVLGLLAIHIQGGATYVQNEATSVVFGMPRWAIEHGVVDRIGSPKQIARMLAADEPRPALPAS